MNAHVCGVFMAFVYVNVLVFVLVRALACVVCRHGYARLQGSIQQTMRSVTKNEIYRLFLREDLLHPLADVLQSALGLVFRYSNTSSGSPMSTDLPGLPITAKTRAIAGVAAQDRARHSIGGTTTATAGLKQRDVPGRLAWGTRSFLCVESDTRRLCENMRICARVC